MGVAYGLVCLRASLCDCYALACCEAVRLDDYGYRAGGEVCTRYFVVGEGLGGCGWDGALCHERLGE